MKARNRLLPIIFAISFIFMSSSVEAKGWFISWWKKHFKQEQYEPPSGSTTGVPLDGGLLALMAGAGIVYFGVRRRKKDQD